jgi:sugar/nucleoside kinase (ribokinase family)
MQKKYALLSVGELLIDFIGVNTTESLLDAVEFQRFQGGSPANMAANMARLGGAVALVSAVGNDNLGKYLKEEINKTGIDISHIVDCTSQPTSVVVVSRTAGTPDFVAYRTADRMLAPDNLPDTLLEQCSIFHTTCFALSQEPAQSTIVDAAKRASNLNVKVSIDCNYAPSIWPERNNAWEVIKNYCSSGAFVKLSADDAERLYQKEIDNEQVIADFHSFGAELVCFTLGGDGAIISSNFGAEKHRVFGKPVKVVDATGAGDAFWSGFLTAYLDQLTIPQCAEAATRMAIMKLGQLGSLPAKIDKNLLYQ